MKFIEFGLKLLQLRFFSGMDDMSVFDGLAVCGCHYLPAQVRVNADQRLTIRCHCRDEVWLADGHRLAAINFYKES